MRSGDRPIEFQWMKDGKEIKETNTVRIQSVQDYSVLLIESVTSESSGNYTCIVKNAFGSDLYTASLTVTAPPTWIKEPKDVITQEGESLTVECSAEGVPTPKITWTSVKLCFKTIC
ncbi:Down syndrome cell adhesion molecule-like protein Dscam2 [Stegodyphus dumicola]|uniref:Down syndrome cell adhesion molecule-like protein Dscam2 n=1 Tax=Stegodyphus dumicola TaxID=202533 RepID=UPI0015B1FAC8|nr:Down syndrome cell adhesion molecule-like protein Dscam2 [Stegodyphus dumicola]